MSHENVETVRRAAAAVGARDLAAFLEMASPTVEWHSSVSEISEGGAYHGHEGIRQYVADLEEAFESFDVVVNEVLTVGEVAIAVGRVSYRGRVSGVAQDEPFGWVFRFDEGKVIYMRAFREPEQALGKLGLSE
ncbi:MAG: hypothetical protein QOG62_1126 [Thermoleophilaceae bacterium]|jgi:ketosteroid isomerase-like protein|nr:hypothetical protein [Thermoleophilaceae bacterium]